MLYLTKLLTSPDYQTKIIAYSLCTSLLSLSASNRSIFEKNQTTIKQIINFYKKHENIYFEYENKVGKDTGKEATLNQTFQVELTANEAKNMDETDQKQMKRVLTTAELHMRSTFLAANSAILLGCCVKWSKFGKTASLLKSGDMDYSKMRLILKRFFEFLEHVQGIQESGRELMKDLIDMFQIMSKENKK